MKPGWQVKKLGDVCELVGGGTPSKANESFYTGDIPWATVRDMKNDVIVDTEFKITREAVAKSSTNIIPKNNVVIATRVGLGKICLLAEDTAINQDLRGVTPKKNAGLSVGYLFRWLRSIAHMIVKEGTGATVQGVKLPFVQSLPIPIPPLAEQQRIVALLDEAFAGIDAAKANAEQNLNNARALFDGYLAQVFSQRGEGWVERRLNKISTVLSGFSFKSSDFSLRNVVPSIKITNVGVREFIMETDSLLPGHFLETYSDFSVPAGSIVIALTRSIISGGLKVAIVPVEYDGALLNQRVAAINADESIVLQQFLYKYLCTQSVIDYVEKQANTLMQPNLSINALRDLAIPFPPLPDQQAIVAKLDALSAETKKLEAVYRQKIAALDELKQSLLHQAFTGEL